MLGFNKKDARVIWRHPVFNRVVVLEISESRAMYAVANVDSHIESLRGEFHDSCVHAHDPIEGKLRLCEILARSYNYMAMQTVAENIEKCVDTTRPGYRD